MGSENELFFQLAIVLGLSAVIGYAVKSLRLPLLIAYLIVGVLLSSLRLLKIDDSYIFSTLPGIGIAFVMFFVGLELNLNELKSLGKPIIFTGVGQITISSIIGFSLALLLGFPQTEAVLLGLGLAFSSTIVVVKTLLEKQDLKSLNGKLSLGITLLEDLVAVIVLMVLTVGSSFLNLGLQSGMPILALLVKGTLLLWLALYFSKHILKRIFKAIASSQELLFLTSIAWCFVFVSLSLLLGFSVVIGAFLAGIALASSPFHFAIQGKVKPLRDFFITLFFIYIGSHVVFQDLGSVLPLVAVFTLFVLFVKPILFLLLLGAFGFKKYTIFQVALTLSEVSEFSLVVMIVGYQLGLISQTALTAMALVGVLSIIISSVNISFAKPIYKILSPFIGWFVHGKFTNRVVDFRLTEQISDHVVVIGAHKVGGSVVEYLKKEGVPLLVVDFNPETIQNLIDRQINAMYGDIGDPELYEFLNLDKAKLVISTAGNRDNNLLFLSELRGRHKNTVVIARASNAEDARLLYEKGANFVILPEVLSGEHLAELLKEHWPSLEYFKDRARVESGKLERPKLAFE